MTVHEFVQKADAAVVHNYNLPGFLEQEVIIQCLTIGNDHDKLPMLKVVDIVALPPTNMKEFPKLKIVVRHIDQ